MPFCDHIEFTCLFCSKMIEVERFICFLKNGNQAEFDLEKLEVSYTMARKINQVGIFMRSLFLCAAILLTNIQLVSSEKKIHLTVEDCLFVKYPVPEKGIVCSNYERALRLCQRLDCVEMHKCAWGPFVAIGEYKGEKIFVGCASVGTGSGLLFTELYVAGAKYIIRYGSDDVKAPPHSDAYLVKIVDEADNLYGFNIQSGVDPIEWV